MSSAAKNQKRILAIDPAGRGFGFAVFEGPERLVDWGVRGAKARGRREAVAHLDDLVSYYGPDVIVVQDLRDSEVRRGFRARAFVEEVARVADANEIAVRAISPKKVRGAFTELGYPTKHKIATRIGELFRELAPRVPPFRKPWMSEDYRMAIFDAVALGLAYFGKRKPSTEDVEPADLAA